MEVYIDDMLVKSKERTNHTTRLQQAFELLRAYGMKLNPTKCAFGVNAGRFLGFMMTQMGIEANPTQLQAPRIHGCLGAVYFPVHRPHKAIFRLL